MQTLATVALLVPDYDQAIAWFTQALGFELREDTDMGGGKRWVRLAPRGTDGADFLLAQAKNEEQRAAVGRQGGGRVWLFLHTDDFWADYDRMKDAGVRFMEDPREEPYGTVVVFEDLWGNKWDFIQRKP